MFNPTVQQRRFVPQLNMAGMIQATSATNKSLGGLSGSLSNLQAGQAEAAIANDLGKLKNPTLSDLAKLSGKHGGRGAEGLLKTMASGALDNMQTGNKKSVDNNKHSNKTAEISQKGAEDRTTDILGGKISKDLIHTKSAAKKDEQKQKYGLDVNKLGISNKLQMGRQAYGANLAQGLASFKDGLAANRQVQGANLKMQVQDHLLRNQSFLSGVKSQLKIGEEDLKFKHDLGLVDYNTAAKGALQMQKQADALEVVKSNNQGQINLADKRYLNSVKLETQKSQNSLTKKQFDAKIDMALLTDKLTQEGGTPSAKITAVKNAMELINDGMNPAVYRMLKDNPNAALSNIKFNAKSVVENNKHKGKKTSSKNIGMTNMAGVTQDMVSLMKDLQK